jgi:D-glycero-D-manno-heptose 1,7-bisphosphate phosphatase
MSRDIVTELPETPSSLENDLFPRLAQDGRIVGASFDGFFIDMGIPLDLARAHDEMARHTRRPAVFFDRDGVLNVDHNYVHRPDQFEWMPGAREAIRLCNDRGYLVFVVTNQAGVAHGYYDEDTVRKLHRWMASELAPLGAHIEAFEFCPHHPEGKVDAYRKLCDRRKPGPGMIRDLLAGWTVDPARSFLVGDRSTDVEAATAAGIAGHVYSGGDLREFVAARLGR